MTLTVVGRLKDDSSVKAKRKAEFAKLYNKMKDMRNYMNLQALIAFLEHVAKSQKCVQREKASAFERKRARKQLEINLKQLNDEKRIEKNFRRAFEKIDLKKKIMKNSGINLRFCPGKFSEMVKKFRDTQMKMA